MLGLRAPHPVPLERFSTVMFVGVPQIFLQYTPDFFACGGAPDIPPIHPRFFCLWGCPRYSSSTPRFFCLWGCPRYSSSTLPIIIICSPSGFRSNRHFRSTSATKLYPTTRHHLKEIYTLTLCHTHSITSYHSPAGFLGYDNRVR